MLPAIVLWSCEHLPTCTCREIQYKLHSEHRTAERISLSGTHVLISNALAQWFDHHAGKMCSCYQKLACAFKPARRGLRDAIIDIQSTFRDVGGLVKRTSCQGDNRTVACSPEHMCWYQTLCELNIVRAIPDTSETTFMAQMIKKILVPLRVCVIFWVSHYVYTRQTCKQSSQKAS